MNAAGLCVTIVLIVGLDEWYTRRSGRAPDPITYFLFGAVAGSAGYAVSTLVGA